MDILRINDVPFAHICEVRLQRKPLFASGMK